MIGDLAQRVARLEAVPQGGGGGGCGDYVFIQEITVAVDGDPLEFAGIPQTFDHLVVELRGCTDDTIGNGNDSDDLLITFAGVTFTPTEDYYWASVFPFNPSAEAVPPAGAGSPVYGESHTFEDVAIPIRQILPQKDINGAGGALVEGTNQAFVTIKFPFYKDASVFKGCLWQAVASVSKGGGNTNPSAVTQVVSSGGGFNDENDGGVEAEAITTITLAPANYGWLAGARAILYGVGRACGGA
jgi:hypothetical protein